MKFQRFRVKEPRRSQNIFQPNLLPASIVASVSIRDKQQRFVVCIYTRYDSQVYATL